MKTKLRKLVSLICVFSLILNLVSVKASGDMNMDADASVASNKIQVLSLSVGSGQGQVGYEGTEASGYIGADSFAVEDGGIFILDGVNRRILVHGNDTYASIDISDVPRARHMKYQNKKIAVTDNTNGITGVYSLTGTQLALISHPEIIVGEVVDELVEIGDSYVVWRTYKNNLYQYDWETETLAAVEEPVLSFGIDKDAETGIASASSQSNGQRWELDAENKKISVHGADNNALIYDQYEYVPNVDMFFVEFSIRKVAADGTETYAIIDFSDWKVHPLEPTYLSSDGEVYLLEGFEDSVVISKVVFGTTDVSKMEQLETLAEVRRAEVARSEQTAELNATTSVANVSRTEARERAEWMINYEWTVMANHQTSSNSTVIVPRYVKDATVGTKVRGIPYCWGGFNGYSSETGYGSFASLVTSTAYTAGNTGDYVISSTIGLDCSGYLSSVYDLSTKYGTADFAGYGHAVTQDQLKPMDFFVIPGGHVSLFAGWNSTGTVATIYECDVYEKVSENVYLNGKTIIEEWTISLLDGADGDAYTSNGYACRSPFHEGECNTAGRRAVDGSSVHETVCSICDYVWPDTKVAHNIFGEIVKGTTTHSFTCSECHYVWPSVAHNKTGESTYNSSTHTCTCSVCGHAWAAEAHNKAGTMQRNTLRHAYDCSVCDYVWPWEEHDNIITFNSTTHTYTCSICDYSRTHPHTFVNGFCSVCGRREEIIWNGIGVNPAFIE